MENISQCKRFLERDLKLRSPKYKILVSTYLRQYVLLSDTQSPIHVSVVVTYIMR
jgi:hypothetical protein